MTPDPPVSDLLTPYRQLARLPSHRGTASFRLGSEVFSGAAEFLLPPTGQAIIAFHAPIGLTSQDLGPDLVIDGDGRVWRLSYRVCPGLCPQANSLPFIGHPR
jgi:hypothetical protein